VAVGLAHAREGAEIAGEIGADLWSGTLHCPSNTGGWLAVRADA